MAKAKFRLNSRGALVAMVSAAFANPAAAATAGRVDFVFGEASLRGANGQVRAVTRGSEVLDGDTLVTGNGRAQIRFTDGAFVSLQPNTEFGVREYRYDGRTDGTERGLFALVRGAMRTVTGAIGRYNRASYQVRTPTATVGIRGTGGLIEVLPDLSTLVKGSSGIWVLTNPAGQIDVPAGTSAIATPDLKEPPKQTSQQPEAPPAPPTVQTTYSEGEKTTDTGEACSVLQTCDSQTVVPPPPPPPPPPMVSGPGYHVSFAYGGTTAGNAIGNSTGLAVATFNTTGQMTAWTDAAGSTSTLLGAHGEGGNVPGVVAWGRWTGLVALPSPQTFGTNEGLHYVVGLPTPVMPTAGTAVPFTQIGATKPTTTDGTGVLGTASVGLSANFVSGTVSANITAAFTTPGTWGYSVTIPGTISGQQMTGSALGIFTTGTPPTPYTCGACNCSASFNGAFFGAGASHAGIAYKIGPDFTSFAVTGAAVLQK
jgi:hypothetical protein